MNAALLVINDQRIPLNDEADPGALIASIMTAVNDGGGVVHIDGRHGNTYDVLVTPATQVMVRYKAMSFESGNPHGPWNAAIDLDL